MVAHTCVFLDTETTGLDPMTDRIFEVGIIAGGVEFTFHIEPEPRVLLAMKPEALAVNRYYERTSGWKWDDEQTVLRLIASLLDGKHIVGAVPDFDARFLKATYERAGLAVPKWHYHLIDVETRAVGWLAAQGVVVELPYDSDALSRLCGVEPPPASERHTALGDARWTKALYEATGRAAQPSSTSRTMAELCVCAFCRLGIDEGAPG